jgi:1-acyl-sn-glycerol-3-phosphate acyltransferase
MVRMSLGDTLSSFYIFWPFILLVIIGSIIIGILFAISVGSILLLCMIGVYYLYIWLTDVGFFIYCKGIFRIQEVLLKRNIRETFRIRGEAHVNPVLYIAHPHGLFSMAPFFHWCIGATEWPADRPVRVAMHSIFFKIPIVREIIEFHGIIQATESSIRSYLEKGESVAILTGGVQEQNLTQSHHMKIVLRKRKGFLRIARSLGVPIVPILTFGENELFPPLTGPWIDWGKRLLKKELGITIPIPTWQSIVNWSSLLQRPLDPPVVTWIGEPILSGRMSDVIAGIEELYQKGRSSADAEHIEIH